MKVIIRYPKDLHKTCMDIADEKMQEIADKGKKLIDTEYANARNNIEGMRNPSLQYISPTTTEVIKNAQCSYTIRSTGNDVLFIEFGTGIYHKNFWGDENGVPVGSYSMTIGKGRYAGKYGWRTFFTDGQLHWTKGYKPAMAYWKFIKAIPFFMAQNEADK